MVIMRELNQAKSNLTEIADGLSCIKTNMINDRDLPFAYLDLRRIAFSLGDTNSLRGMSCTLYRVRKDQVVYT